MPHFILLALVFPLLIACGQQTGEDVDINASRVPNLSSPIDFTKEQNSGKEHSCNLLQGGEVVCLGGNQYGQLGDGSYADSDTPVPVYFTGSRRALALSAGDNHTCALLDDNSLHCWGNNLYGQLGDGTTDNRGLPTPVVKNVLAVSAGKSHTCAILEDGTLTCWGANGSGQLGNGKNSYGPAPVAVLLPEGSSVQSVSAGGIHTCALLDDGSVMCWGLNLYGQLGNQTNVSSNTPVEVHLENAQNARAIATGSAHSCALLENDSVVCWGLNIYGQLGDGTIIDANTPVLSSLKSDTSPLDIHAKGQQTCVTFDDNSFQCWGATQ